MTYKAFTHNQVIWLGAKVLAPAVIQSSFITLPGLKLTVCVFTVALREKTQNNSRRAQLGLNLIFDKHIYICAKQKPNI